MMTELKISALQIQGVSKSFYLRPASFSMKAPKKISVLENVDLTIPRGGIMALMGANGAGKTTLLKIISSLISPDKGIIHIFGNRPEDAKRHLSFVLGDERSFYWRLTGRQNLEFFCALYGFSKKIASERIAEAVELFEIENLDKLYQVYSTGQKCRLALARSFMAQAKLVLMDEPTRSLDHHTKINLHQIIRKMNKELGTTFLIVTHDLHEAEVLGTLFGTLHGGTLSATPSYTEFSRDFHAAGIPL